MAQKRDLESLAEVEIASVSSDSDSSDDAPPTKKQQRAAPDTDDIEPDLELRHEFEKITAEVSLLAEKVARKEDYVKNMQMMTGDMSMIEMNTMRKNYERIVKKFNKERKNGFKDIQLALEGTCPGCKNCTGDERTLEPKHSIDSINCTREALSIGAFSQGVVRLNNEIFTIQPESEEGLKAMKDRIVNGEEEDEGEGVGEKEGAGEEEGAGKEEGAGEEEGTETH